MSHPPIEAEFKRYPQCRDKIKAHHKCQSNQNIFGKMVLDSCRTEYDTMYQCLVKARAERTKESGSKRQNKVKKAFLEKHKDELAQKRVELKKEQELSSSKGSSDDVTK